MSDTKARPPALVGATWDEFAAAGLLWWVNRALHLFGWAIVRDVGADGTTLRAYPARCRYRGFSEGDEDEGFKALTLHLDANMATIKAAVEEK